MDKNRILVGCLVVVLCGLLLTREQWFLETTSKGQTLVRWFGQQRGLMVLRGLILAAMTFGALLASGVIQPIRWN